MAGKNKPNEIYITRVYDAPVKMVWDAWTDPKQVAQWWGPRGFTITTEHKDVRTGGTWKYMMHGPDGVDYPNHTKFLEVEKYSRLVYDHGGNDQQPPMFRVTVSFSETAGKTKMEMSMALATAEAANETKKFIRKAGGDSTWDRLAEFLSAKDQFVINRSFSTPIDTMFKMWTDPKHFSEWLPPTGFKMEFIRADIRPGGSIFYRMVGDGGMKMYGKANYREVSPPDHIVYEQIFCDENENIIRHPMSTTWPETMLTQVKLSAESPDQTRVTITWEPVGKLTQAELDTFKQAKGGMTQGWTGSFDKLEEYLKH